MRSVFDIEKCGSRSIRGIQSDRVDFLALIAGDRLPIRRGHRFVRKIIELAVLAVRRGLIDVGTGEIYPVVLIALNRVGIAVGRGGRARIVVELRLFIYVRRALSVQHQIA